MARSGAGMSVGYTLPLAATIRNCLFARNATTNAGGYGGGIYLGNQCARVLIANCTVVSNYAYEGGGGISFQGNYDLTNTVINCLVVSNLDRSAGGRTCNLRFVSGTATFSNAVAYSCSWPSNDVFRVNDGRGNTTNPVQFLAFPEQDYRCDSQSACVNAGTNEAWMADAVDLQGRRRIDPFSRRVDIGGYEYLPKGNLLQMR